MKLPQVGLVVVSLLLSTVRAQINQINSIAGSGQSAFYLDSARDCDGTPREVGQSVSMIYGKSTQDQGTPTLSCTLTLNTENIREPHRFKLEFLGMYIGDPGVHFYVYDGEFNGRLRWAFSRDNGLPSNLDFDFTTGQQVTFRLTKGRTDTNYDIRVTATPVPSAIEDCRYGNEYGCDEYNYKYRILDTKDIIGIVGGVFALIVLIVVVVVVCCYRKQRGVTQKWKEEKLGHVNTAASLHSLNGKHPKHSEATASRPWTSESSKNGFASIRRSPNLPRAKIARSSRMGDAALSDSNASIPAKRPLPPPQVNYHPRGASRGRDRYRDQDSDRSSEVSFNTDKNYSEKTFNSRGFSEKTFTSRGLSEKTISSSKNMVPPTYREVMRRDRAESESSADEHSFVQANDSHQQSKFVEKVITPRVKPAAKTSPKFQRVPPPPEEDLEYDSIEPKKLAKARMAEAATQDDSTDESETDNESDEESEEEESEEESEEEEKPDQADAVYSKPDKARGAQPPPVAAPQIPGPQGAFQPPNPQQFPPGPGYPGYPPAGVHQPQPRYGYPGQPPQAQHYPQYPQGGQPQGYPQPYPQPPVQQPPPQPGRDPYHQANFTVPLQPQQQPQSQYRPRGNRPHKSSSQEPGTQPAGQPPIYSYLVNRGYRPLDGRHSPVSTSTGASNLSGDRNLQNDDSEFSANLDSGVELMKRKK